MTTNGSDYLKYQYRVGSRIYDSYDQALSALIREMNDTSADCRIEVIPNRTY